MTNFKNSLTIMNIAMRFEKIMNDVRPVSTLHFLGNNIDYTFLSDNLEIFQSFWNPFRRKLCWYLSGNFLRKSLSGVLFHFLGNNVYFNQLNQIENFMNFQKTLQSMRLVGNISSRAIHVKRNICLLCLTRTIMKTRNSVIFLFEVNQKK